MEIKAIERVRDEGRTAAKEGMPRSANPYPSWSAHAVQWDHGYCWYGFNPVKWFTC